MSAFCVERMTSGPRRNEQCGARAVYKIDPLDRNQWRYVCGRHAWRYQYSTSAVWVELRMGQAG